MPFLFADVALKWLDNALDCGIDENKYWSMTFAELKRAIDSKQRTQREEARQKAMFDYVLSDLIGRSVARIHSSSNKMPKLADVYPSLFVAEEIEEAEQKKRDELSAERFKAFANSINKRMRGDSKK